jgi:ketosteroid isomerase-like protein
MILVPCSLSRRARRLSLLIATLWLITVAPLATAQEPDREAPELLALLDRFLAAADDPAMHQRFWDNALIYTSSSGARFGKADILEGMRGGAPTEAPEVRYRAEDAQVMSFGDVAVVAFRLVGETAGTEASPAEISQYFNTGTFRRTDGEWRAIAWQATRIPDEP